MIHQRPQYAPLKKWATRTLCSHAVGRAVGWAYRDCIPYCGLRVDTTSHTIPAKNKAALFFGVYESAERRFVRRYLNPQLSSIELGSSLGGVSSHIADRLAHAAKLVCVEANPAMVALLRQNLRRNGSHLDWQIVHAAVHYGCDSVHFTAADNPLDSAVSKGSQNTATVPTVQLGSILERLSPHESFQLVCDIEGAESQLLQHDADALRRCERAIVEFHNVKTWSRAELKSKWLACGFELIDEFGPVCVMEQRFP